MTEIFTCQQVLSSEVQQGRKPCENMGMHDYSDTEILVSLDSVLCAAFQTDFI